MVTGVQEVEWVFKAEKNTFEYFTQKRAFERLGDIPDRRSMPFAVAAKEFALEFGEVANSPLEGLRHADDSMALGVRIGYAPTHVFPLMVDLRVAEARNFFRFVIDTDGKVVYHGRHVLPEADAEFK